MPATDRPIPLDLWVMLYQHQLDSMRLQCELGRQWINEGLLFLATGISDIQLVTIWWTRQWIAEHL